MGVLKYLPCSISSGMFSDEFSIEVDTNGRKFSLFVDKDMVKSTGKDTGLLLVDLLDAESGTVALPSEALENGTRYIKVPVNSLTSDDIK